MLMQQAAVGVQSRSAKNVLHQKRELSTSTPCDVALMSDIR
jgi:hypothetical protein